jgi:hypothetical protein
MDTNNTPQVDIQGPITRARARQLNLQVIWFLRNYSCAFESSMLPNDLIILRNEGKDQQGRGKDLGGVEDQRGRPDQDGSPILLFRVVMMLRHTLIGRWQSSSNVLPILCLSTIRLDKPLVSSKILLSFGGLV